MATSRNVELVGRVLGDRYRLLRPLGTGTSAQVYVAEDVTLRRRVAIKILHPALAADESFLRRFRAEAQVVAALRHPNILRVYDWGQDGGSPYLVMELLEGGSLRALLDRGELLTLAQAAVVGADAARALDYAHRRSLVHRDIKPANLIFDDEGRVTVADFGLARALAEATWTEPAGAVVGTARYAAPEQVLGQSLGPQADVYGLALVLLEATTGAVPFASDTKLGTLMARIAEPLPLPASLGPLGPVLARAGAVDPSERSAAAVLANELDSLGRVLGPPGRIRVSGPAETGRVERDDSPTAIPGAPKLFDIDRVDADDATAPAVATGLADQTGPMVMDAAPAPEPPSGRKPGGQDRAGRKRRRWPIVVAILVVLALAGAYGGYQVLRPLRSVPVLRGRTVAAASRALAREHLHLDVAGRAYNATALAGTVLSQRPARGQLRQGGTVSVVLSRGPQPVAVPNLVGETVAAATAVLAEAKLALGTQTGQTSLTIATGEIISQSPSSGSLLPGRSVNLVVSTGKPQAPVPTLSGASAASFAAASTALSAVGLVAAEDNQYSNTVQAGMVVSTSPAAGTSVIVGSTVTVVISEGPHMATVPSVHGDSVGAATTTLSADGFAVGGVDGNPTDTVTGTSPAAGTSVLYGSSVEIDT